MDRLKYKIEENQTTLLLYKHKLKEKKIYDIKIHFLIYLFDKEEHKFNIVFPKAYFPDDGVTFSLKN